MNFHKITYPDVNNGLGCRATLWVSGCTHRCKGCQNPETWCFKSGKPFTEESQRMLFDVIALPYIKGLTLSGGDPLDNYEGVLELLKDFRNTFGDSKDVWLYTGSTFEEIQEKYKEILDYVDFIVDGPFIEHLKDITLPFMGSSNQHIRKKDKNRWIILDNSEFD